MVNRSFKSKNKISGRGNRSFLNKKVYGILKYSRLLLKILLLVCVLFLAFLFFRFLYLQVGELNQIKLSTEMQSGIRKSDQVVEYDEDSVFTLLILSDFGTDNRLTIDGITLIQLDYNSPEIRVVSMNPNIYFRKYSYAQGVDSSYGVTFVRVKDLMVVGHLQNPPIPLAYAFYQFREFLAIPIDGYLYIDDEANEVSGLGLGYPPSEAISADVEYDQWSQKWNEYWIDNLGSVSLLNIWSNRQDIPKLESNMSAVELYEFIRIFQRVGSENIHSIILSQENLVEVVDDGGETVNFLSEFAIDEVLDEFTGDVRMDREQARIEIFNGSGVNGLGNRYRRWIGHMGGDVIRVENAPGIWENSVIYVTDIDEFEYTLSKVTLLWVDDIEVIEGRPDFVTTGDVIVVLGSE